MLCKVTYESIECNLLKYCKLAGIQLTARKLADNTNATILVFIVVGCCFHKIWYVLILANWLIFVDETGQYILVELTAPHKIRLSPRVSRRIYDSCKAWEYWFCGASRFTPCTTIHGKEINICLMHNIHINFVLIINYIV